MSEATSSGDSYPPGYLKLAEWMQMRANRRGIIQGSYEQIASRAFGSPSRWPFVRGLIVDLVEDGVIERLEEGIYRL